MPTSSVPTLCYFEDLSNVTAKTLYEMTEGHFFEQATMRFFNSRVGASRLLDAIVRQPVTYALAVVVSSRNDVSPRHYEVVVICPYGRVLRSRDIYFTRVEANKELKAVGFPYGCDCAGCNK